MCIQALVILSNQIVSQAQETAQKASEMLIQLIKGDDLDAKKIAIELCISNKLVFAFDTIVEVYKDKGESQKIKEFIERITTLAFRAGINEIEHVLDRIHEIKYANTINKLKYYIMRNPASSEKELRELGKYAELGIKIAIIALKEVSVTLRTRRNGVNRCINIHHNGIHASPYLQMHEISTRVLTPRIKDRTNGKKLWTNATSRKNASVQLKIQYHDAPLVNGHKIKKLRRQQTNLKRKYAFPN